MEINQNITDHRDIFKNFFYMSRWAMPVARATPHMADAIRIRKKFRKAFENHFLSTAELPAG